MRFLSRRFKNLQWYGMTLKPLNALGFKGFNFGGICWKTALSNNSSNRFILGAFLLQCCDDKLGNIGIILQQLIGKIRLISRCFFGF